MNNDIALSIIITTDVRLLLDVGRIIESKSLRGRPTFWSPRRGNKNGLGGSYCHREAGD